MSVVQTNWRPTRNFWQLRVWLARETTGWKQQCMVAAKDVSVAAAIASELDSKSH